MRLADLSARRRREMVALALDAVLQDLEEPTASYEVIQKVAERLDTKETEAVSRLLTGWAPHIPEAERGDTFIRYGKTFQRWIWWPKGQTPGGMTRKAKREAPPAVWRGKIYACAEDMEAAKQAAGIWEV